MHYPCSENKGADQLRSYCEADLRLCFRTGKNPVFSRCASFTPGLEQLLGKVNDSKAIGPGNMSNVMLKECAKQ